jgi:ATP-binding cassette subfamily B protein
MYIRALATENGERHPHVFDARLAEKPLYRVIEGQGKKEGKVADHKMLSGLTDGLLILVRDGAAYAFLVYLLMQNKLALGDFFDICRDRTFSDWFPASFFNPATCCARPASWRITRTFIELPDKSNTGPGAPLPLKDRAPAIKLSHVGYTYEGTDAPALETSIWRSKRERIALVGANGAGKTTLLNWSATLQAEDRNHSIGRNRHFGIQSR